MGIFYTLIIDYAKYFRDYPQQNSSIITPYIVKEVLLCAT